MLKKNNIKIEKTPYGIWAYNHWSALACKGWNQRCKNLNNFFFFLMQQYNRGWDCV